MAQENNLILLNKNAFGQFKKFFESPAALFERAFSYIKACHENPLYKSEQIKKPGKEIIIPVGTDGNDTDEPIVIPPDPLVEIPMKRAPTWYGLALYCGTSSKYFDQFKRKLRNGEITDPDGSWQNCMNVIEDMINSTNYELAAAGFLNPMLTARYLGLADELKVKKDDENKPKEIFKIGDMELEW